MLRKISFKGVIIGAIADVGGSNIWGIIVAIYLSSKYQIFLLPHAQQASRLMYLMSHDPAIFWLNMIIGGGFSILGGYLAARIAKHNELLNGTLSSFLCEVFTLLSIGSSPVYAILLSFVGNPLLGFIGGYLRMWEQKKKINRKS